MNSKPFREAFLFSIILFVVSHSTMAQDSLNMDYVLDGIESNRSSVRTLEFDVTVVFVRLESGSKITTQASCAMDIPSGKFRLECETTGDGLNGVKGGQCIITPDYQISRPWEWAETDSIGIFPPERSTPDWVAVPDPRVLGLILLPELRRWTPFEELLADYRKLYRPNSVSREDQNLVVVRKTSSSTYTMTISEEKDYWPVKHVSDDGKQRTEATLSLTEFSGVLLPKTYEVSDGIEKATVAFKWKSVNQELDEELFWYESLNLDGIKKVTDHRSGASILLVDFERRAKTKSESPRSYARIAFGILTVVLITALILRFRSRLNDSGYSS